MSSSAIPEAISIDTQVFVSTSFNFETRAFDALRSHLASGRLRLVMSDITVREVKARIKKRVAEELAKHKKFRKEAHALRNSSLADVNAALAKLDENAIIDDLCNQFEEFLEETEAEITDADPVSVGPVFEKYFAEEPPFGPGDNKKVEFPDAFTIQSLAEWTEENGQYLFVVSGDELFRKGCESCDKLYPKKTLVEVLNHVASDDEKLAAFIRSETAKRADEIATEAKRQFEDYFFWVEDEDGDAEVSVTNLEPSGDPEIIEIKSGEAVVQMAFHANSQAHLSYSDSSTGIWDSEDGRMMFMEEREEEVDLDDDLVVEFHVTFEGADPDTFEIDQVKLTEPSEGYGIKTQEAEDWPYK